MTMVCPSTAPSRSEMMRAMPSVGPPGGNGTTILTGCLPGQAWACSGLAANMAPAAHSAAASSVRTDRAMPSRLLDRDLGVLHHAGPQRQLPGQHVLEVVRRADLDIGA